VKGSPDVQAAARRILAGDDSINAANVLESAILLDHGDDDDYDELVWALSMYHPRAGHPYFGVEELRAAVLAELADDDPAPGAR
jgi:hypothetical protein